MSRDTSRGTYFFLKVTPFSVYATMLNIPRDLHGVALSYLEPYMEIMVRSPDEPEMWELQKMASLGMVRDPHLLAWAEGKGLPRDERLFANMVFHGVEVPEEAVISERLLNAAAAGASPDRVMDLMERTATDQDDVVCLGDIGDIVVKRGRISFIEEVFKFDRPSHRDPARWLRSVIEHAIPISRDERILDIYAGYLDRAGFGVDEVQEAAECGNLYLLEKLTGGEMPVNCWVDILSCVRGMGDLDLLAWTCRKIEEDPNMNEECCEELAEDIDLPPELMDELGKMGGKLSQAYKEARGDA